MSNLQAQEYALKSILRHITTIHERLPNNVRSNGNDLPLANAVRLLKKDIKYLNRILNEKRDCDE
jgi:hypothetical protein